MRDTNAGSIPTILPEWPPPNRMRRSRDEKKHTIRVNQLGCGVLVCHRFRWVCFCCYPHSRVAIFLVWSKPPVDAMHASICFVMRCATSLSVVQFVRLNVLPHVPGGGWGVWAEKRGEARIKIAHNPISFANWRTSRKQINMSFQLPTPKNKRKGTVHRHIYILYTRVQSLS